MLRWSSWLFPIHLFHFMVNFCTLYASSPKQCCLSPDFCVASIMSYRIVVRYISSQNNLFWPITSNLLVGMWSIKVAILWVTLGGFVIKDNLIVEYRVFIKEKASVCSSFFLQNQYSDIVIRKTAYSLCSLSSLCMSVIRSLNTAMDESGILYTIPIVMLGRVWNTLNYYLLLWRAIQSHNKII